MNKEQTKIIEQAMKRIDKVVINTGLGRISQEGHFKDKVMPELMKDFAAITGQKPSPRPAKKSIAGFKLREGMIVGLKTTLRGKRKRQFIERLIAVVFPRIRDFRGIHLKSIDKDGNLNVGIKEHVAFPEINPDTFHSNFGLQITIVQKEAMERKVAIEFYRGIGMPLEKA